MSGTSPVIAIDGPSASGKGTIARKLAAHFGFAHLDTGLLYRAVGISVLETGGDPSDPVAAERAAKALEASDIQAVLANPALRQDRASVAASKSAAIPGVRAALLKFQQDFASNPPSGKQGAVLDGRDIGTVIAPSAPVKLYVTASTEARAKRRWHELKRGEASPSLQGTLETASETAVLADMKERDARDASRAIAPAKPAPDAVVIDTTTMTADQAFAKALAITEEKLRSFVS
jgi:cytidylate kinase